MRKNKNFKPNQIVRFKKKATVFDLDSKRAIQIPKGTTAEVILDEDVGTIGACKIKLKKQDGSVIVVETNDENLEIQK